MRNSSGRTARQPGPGFGQVQNPRIAVDLLGGDDAPAVVVDGALLACGADPDLLLLLVGPRGVADEVLRALDEETRARISVLPVDRGVGMGDGASRGADRATSIASAAAAVADGKASALVSAGARGATVTAAVIAIGRLPHVYRPALAAVLPTPVGRTVLLDVGAGMQARPVDLIQHGALGIGYARVVLGLTEVRVGLLSVGSEPGKGDRLRRAADAALRAHPLPGGARYIGLVEGGDVVTGARADVVITDGFTGNVLLKGVEAALSGVRPRSPEDIPRAAALLGVSGTVVVCHGAATGAEVASGIGLAATLSEFELPRRLAGVGSRTGLITNPEVSR